MRKPQLSIAIVATICAALLVFALVGCSSSSSESTDESEQTEQEEQAEDEEEEEEEEDTSSEDEDDATAVQTDTSLALQGVAVGENGYIETPDETYTYGTWVATVTVTGYGSFDIELDADSAPVSVSNFCHLASNGYYDGLAFYRVVEGFCLQGGTLGNSASGSDDELSPIIGEFSDNGVDNELADNFERGVVAMARTSEANSATTTFFITLDSSDSVSQSLNGLYAAFGTIDEEGMSVVDAIVEATADKIDDSGMGIIEDEDDMPIIESITIEQL